MIKTIHQIILFFLIEKRFAKKNPIFFQLGFSKIFRDSDGFWSKSNQIQFKLQWETIENHRKLKNLEKHFQKFQNHFFRS